ncbi:hypothetical protein [Thiospirillum jenense]|uniref:Uncharacterized protein n=1 Tax=Thiospirillum jenense TaxID=1653858 RepID=A0A839HKK2_9GAMM|nr:hypothetical protein [Thiospirillum jenense]MBB1127218.1 hypothetical protein [Thiospirillum jenense]
MTQPGGDGLGAQIGDHQLRTAGGAGAARQQQVVITPQLGVAQTFQCRGGTA